MATYGNFYRGMTVSLTAQNSDYQNSRQFLFNDINNPGVSSDAISASLANTMSSSSEFAALVEHIHLRLGEPTLQVELPPSQIAAAIDAAVFRFSYICNSYFITSWIASLMGLSVNYTEQDFTSALPKTNNTFLKAFSLNQEYDGLYNDHTEKRRAYIDYNANEQRKDIYALSVDGDSGLALEQYVASVSGYGVHFDKFYHGPGTYVNRLYNPEMNQQFMQAEFGFPTFPTDTVFYILPLWQDIQRGQLLSASDYVRKSAYRHNVYNRTLELIPRPQTGLRVWFDYHIDLKPGTSESPLQQSSFSGLSYLATSAENKVVTQFANVPIKDLTYDSMNPVGRAWVREYTFAICMQTLAFVRGKVPISLPDGQQLTLNDDQLLSEANNLKTTLETELKDRLGEMDTYKILEKESQKADANYNILVKNAPMPVYMRRTLS